MGKKAHVPKQLESSERIKRSSKNKTKALIRRRKRKKKKKEEALCWNNNKENVAIHDFSFMDSWRH